MPAMQSSKGAALQTGSVNAAAARNKPGLFDRIADHFRHYWQLWVLTAPALFFVGLFAYVPMWGIQLAFRESTVTGQHTAPHAACGAFHVVLVHKWFVRH